MAGRQPTRIPAVITLVAQGTSNPGRSSGRVAGPLPSRQLRGPAPLVQHFRDRQLNMVQQSAQQATSQATANPLGQANLITGVKFTAGGTTVVQHGLGAAYTGYCVINVSGGYGAFQVVANPQVGLNASQIKIQSQHDCTGDVLVY